MKQYLPNQTPYFTYWREDEEGYPDCGIFSESRPGHAYSIARCPKYVSKEEWLVNSEFIIKACNYHNDLVEILRMLSSTTAILNHLDKDQIDMIDSILKKVSQ